MAKVGLYIGRFQPFHLGHLSVVKEALKKVDHLIIAIGSAQYSHEEDNPFNLEERTEMIQLTLNEARIEQKFYTIKGVNDIHNNEKWPCHVQKKVSSFDIIFVGDDGIVKELFQKNTNIPVVKIEETIFVRGSKIRQKMINEEQWQKWLSPSVVKYIEKIKGCQRLIELNQLF